MRGKCGTGKIVKLSKTRRLLKYIIFSFAHEGHESRAMLSLLASTLYRSPSLSQAQNKHLLAVLGKVRYNYAIKLAARTRA